jgi:GWxTD domain-containing protein
MRHRSLGSLAAILAVLPAEAIRAGEDASWADGEVRYLLLDEERAEWKDLGTDGEREAFVARFWARRDPDPATPANEYKDEIARRLAAANRLFRTEGRAGWLTDRGRIYLTFGAPDESAEDAAGTVAESGSFGDTAGVARSVTRGSITWTYRRLAGWNAPPNQRFEFQASSAGAYLLSKPLPADWKQVLPQSGSVTASAGKALAAPPRAGKANGQDRAREQLLAALAGTVAGALPLEIEPLTFPAGRKEALVVVALHVATSSPLELVAGAFAAGDRSMHAMVMPLAAAAPRPRSFAFLLAPGSYRLAVVARDPGTGDTLGAAVAPFEVPDYAGGAFRASSAVLAREVRELAPAPPRLDQVVEDVVIGNVGLAPSRGNRFAAGATVDLVFFLAGAKPGAGGALDVAADYRLVQGGEVKNRFPTQTIAGAVVDQPIPLAGLAPGAYRIEMDLADRATGAKTSAALDLVIE